MFSNNTMGQVVVTYDTPGPHTFDVPTDVTIITVEAWGAGAGGYGGGTSSNSRGGGGGGAYASSIITVTQSSYSITVGAGGSPQNNGGNSTFGISLVVAAGGSTPTSYNNFGFGGTTAASTGDVEFAGGNGGNRLQHYGGGGGGGSAFNNAAGNPGANGTNPNGGAGGTGTGNGGNGGNDNGSGSNGNAPGGGGGGKGDNGALSGSGAVGMVVITYESPCSGTPDPGNTISTDDPVCADEEFTLSLENATSGSGVTYQWQSSSDGSTWNDESPSSFTLINTNFPSLPANTNVYGDASVTGGELVLTPASGSQQGGFVIQTTPGSNVTEFTASFDYRIWDGSGADGLSLSYASNIANDQGGGESGEGSGIILMLDTYDNSGTGTNSQIRINYGGSQIWANTLGAYDLRNASYRNVTLTVDNSGQLSLTIGGTSIVTGLSLSGYLAEDKSDWKFKFSGRTGGSYDKHSIDNLNILMVYGNHRATHTTSQTGSTWYRCQVTCLTNTGTSTPLKVGIAPSFTSSVLNNVSCYSGNDANISIVITSPDVSPYTFSTNNGTNYNQSFTGTYPNFTLTNLSAAEYPVRVKDNNGCESPGL